MGFSDDRQGCSEGFPMGKARGKSQGAALPAKGKPRGFCLSGGNALLSFQKFPPISLDKMP